MNPRPKTRSLRGPAPRMVVCLALTWLLAGAPAAGQGETDLRPEEAVDLYDAGRYEEARAILEALDAEGRAGGALLYRLSFCRRAAGDSPGEREALDRALAALERENEAASDLETPFYLANAYRNLGRRSEARTVAAAATERVESGKLAKPKDPMGMFRLAKLYADQNREAEASTWYRKSLEGYAAAGRSYPGNVAWARRYLGDSAYAKTDYATAEREYTAMVEAAGGSPADFDRLAVARVRLGKWNEAREAWRTAEKLDPARGDRPRYCWRLADMAAHLGALPERAPDGREWSRLGKEDLEALMLQETTAAREAIAEAADATAERRAELQQRIDRAKPHFVRAALEYAVRNHPIRETAFAAGYAPMIFHPRRWELPAPSAKETGS